MIRVLAQPFLSPLDLLHCEGLGVYAHDGRAARHQEEIVLSACVQS